MPSNYPALAKPGLNQIIAVIQKYQQTVISAINADREAGGEQPLQPIQEFHKGPKVRTAYPWLTVAYEGTAFTESSEQTTEQHLMFVVQLEAGDFDSEYAQDAAIDYMRALHAIFAKVAGPPPSFSDWESQLPIQHETVPSNVTAPWPVGTVKQIFVEREEQMLVRREGADKPAVEVSLTLRFDLEET